MDTDKPEPIHKMKAQYLVGCSKDERAGYGWEFLHSNTRTSNGIESSNEKSVFIRVHQWLKKKPTIPAAE